MRLLGVVVAAALAFAGAANADESARDKAAIAAVETALAPAVRTPNGPGQQTLAARMAELHVPGVSIAYFENGRIVWTRAYGVSQVGDARPVTPETLFQAASMSKALAAAAALRLVEQGKLDLDRDVNTTLKAWKVPESPYTATEKVTLRRLLSHTAGLTVSGFPGYEAGKPAPTLVQVLNGEPPANTPPVRSWEAPGGAFAYSGGGFEVAQLMITEASGKPYPQVVADLVLKPAGMARSTIAQPLPDRLSSQATVGHDRKGAVIPGARNTYPENAAAGLWTTPSDYARFMMALQAAYAGRGHSFLSQASARTMLTPVSNGYAMGEIIERRKGRTDFQHSGGNAGYICISMAFLDGSGEGVVVMTNADGGGLVTADIVHTLAMAYGWGDPDPNPALIKRAPYNPPAAAK
jgi:CubicO group peptidase (beta-lactamase class C family)